MLTPQLIRLMTSAPKKADRKVSITKPGTNAETSISMAALTTRVNSPSVRRLIGSVRRRTTGLITAFTTPRIQAATMPIPRLSILTPSINDPATTSASKLMEARRRNPSIEPP
jgi:hypothetical protein